MEKSKAGRPPKHKTADEMELKVQQYFEELSPDDVPTTAGLALYLGFCDRQSLYDQTGRSAEFSCAIKKALMRIESFHEKQLLKNGCTGSIFWLKNHKWRDTQEQKQIDDDGKAIAPVINVNFVKPDK